MRSQSILYDDSAPKPEFLSRKHEWRIISIASSTYESSVENVIVREDQLGSDQEPGPAASADFDATNR